MKVECRQAFLKDLKVLKSSPAYERIFEIAFTTLPNAEGLAEISNIKPMEGYLNRYRIRVGDYRIEREVYDDFIEVIRTLHRKDFYRYFP